MYDLGIIGGGPAGYTAAELATKRGLKVLLFEENELGGICLNEGCIPTKVLLHSAKLLQHVKEAEKYGITTNNSHYAIDLQKVIDQKERIVRKLKAGVKSKLTNDFITVISGHATIVGKTNDMISIQCGEALYMVSNLLIATGSREIVPPISGLSKSTAVCSYRDLLNETRVPGSLVIIGGGAIGIEFANFYNRMGAQVTVIEMQDEILAGTDRELGAMVRAEYEKRGVQFFLKATITFIDEQKVLFLHDNEEKQVIGEKILVSVGRQPNLEGFGLENFDIQCFRKGIYVTNQMQTSEPNVYAAGDVTSFTKLAHAAYREAEVVVNTIMGINDQMNFNSIPFCIYSDPEIASAGMTEEALNVMWLPHRTLKLPMTYSGKYIIENDSFQGLCKIIIDEAEHILGVHLVGNSATEIIAAASMAIDAHMTLDEWRKTMFPHPTVSEIIKETLSL